LLIPDDALPQTWGSTEEDIAVIQIGLKGLAKFMTASPEVSVRL
jgi:hypothetical protein